MSFQFDGILIGTFKIYYYGILIMIGAVAATWMASREVKRYGQDPEMAWDLLPWALIGGIIGARLWHVLFPPASMVDQGITTAFYLTHPLDALNLRKGGLGIPGGVIGGLIAIWIYCSVKKVPLGPWVDAIAPGLALAQAIGRFGNYFNQEVYGAPTNLPWKLPIDLAHRLPGYENIEDYHPLFLYEALWNLGNMAFLLWISRRYADWLKTWDVFLIYLIVYGVGRFLLEFLRLDPAPLGGLNINQAIMGSVALVAAVILFLRHRKSANNL
jgi:phosphatidylglycerol:prolipoprotein diacylglycerol transferase